MTRKKRENRNGILRPIDPNTQSYKVWQKIGHLEKILPPDTRIDAERLKNGLSVSHSELNISIDGLKNQIYRYKRFHSSTVAESKAQWKGDKIIKPKSKQATTENTDVALSETKAPEISPSETEAIDNILRAKLKTDNIKNSVYIAHYIEYLSVKEALIANGI